MLQQQMLDNYLDYQFYRQLTSHLRSPTIFTIFNSLTLHLNLSYFQHEDAIYAQLARTDLFRSIANKHIFATKLSIARRKYE